MFYLTIVIGLILVGFLIVKSVGFVPNDSSKYTNIDASEAKLLIEQGSITPLDVRTQPEIKQGKIDRALELNVTSPSFSKRLRELDKNIPYLVYCRSGRRSIKACNIMDSHGFSRLYNLEGGFNTWKKI